MARPHWAVDERRHRPFGQIAIGVNENLAYWHIAPVVLILPPQSHVDAANNGEVWGAACFTLCNIYVRMDLNTHKLWFLEFKAVASQANGVTKTFMWFDEEAARIRWWSSWQGLLEDAGTIVPVKPMCFLRPDSSFDYGPMKVQYRGIQFATNTPNIGPVTMAQIHDGATLPTG